MEPTTTGARQIFRSLTLVRIFATSIGICLFLTGCINVALADTGKSSSTSNMTNSGMITTMKLLRENDTVLIDGIRAGERDTSPYPQGLSIILQYLGHKDADYIRMMGYSGMAFTLQIDLTGPIREGVYDVAWWPNDCWAFDMRLPFISKAFGRELTKFGGDPVRFGKDLKSQYHALFEPVIIKSVENGRPLLGQRDAARIITGYDKANSTAIGIWPTPGQPVFGDSEEGYPWGLIQPGNKIKAISQKEAELESLRWAVALWEDTAVASMPSGKLARPHIKGNPAKMLLTGKKAYAKWLELLQGQAEGIGPGRNAWDQNIIIHLRYNRTAAVNYLTNVAKRQPEAMAHHLRKAADLYQKVLDDTANAPFWSQFGNNPDIRPQKLREYTEMIRRIAKLEARAIAEIKLAIPGSSAIH